MTSARDLFSDEMTGDEFSLAQKAIANADTALFLRVLSQAIARSQ